MTLSDKLKITSKIVRYLIWFLLVGIPAWYLVQVIYGFGYLNIGVFKIRISDSVVQNIADLWQIPDINHVTLTVFVLPRILLPLSSLYFLQRLFRHYSNGEFFSKNVMNTFGGLLWVKFIFALYRPIFDGFTDRHISGENIFILFYQVNVSELFTYVLMLFIYYIHRLASKIEKENREFI